ncbi:LysR family transcriptional regulator [Oxalicibacterium solurbis]|uniref:LysR family transcriptional regulator n=1 Tax=Oxalicibacterium solurbis TaxID=69280 RepID=A0A8J3F6D9_9BURK|nr:LysR family transcriptional regulator [Oxalicibacterium solurbis]GGI54979.1 LysR family transcriptional regulator [Oxalicibacterium solurbis]
MRLTLRQLQIFLAVADHGSTMAAADAVALSQSAASAALKELEGLLGIHLFDRIGKRLILNDNGRMLLPQARQMLDAAATMEAQFHQPDAADAVGLRIAASTTIGIYLLPHMLAHFAQHSASVPQVTIANTRAVAAAVAAFDVDVGLIEGPCHEPELRAEPWLADELVVVCAPHHPLAARDGKVPLADLRQAGWLLREVGSGTREAVEHALLPHLHMLHSAGEFSNAEAIKHAASAGLGLACLSRLVVADLVESGRLVELRTTLPRLQRHFYLIHRRNKLLSARLEFFMQFCRDWAN